MKANKFLLDEIKCDKENIQTMVNLLKDCETKGEFRLIQGAIKDTIKATRNSKLLLDEKLWVECIHNTPRLFEVEPSPLDHQEHFKTMDSFFGKIEEEGDEET